MGSLSIAGLAGFHAGKFSVGAINGRLGVGAMETSIEGALEEVLGAIEFVVGSKVAAGAASTMGGRVGVDTASMDTVGDVVGERSTIDIGGDARVGLTVVGDNEGKSEMSPVGMDTVGDSDGTTAEVVVGARPEEEPEPVGDCDNVTNSEGKVSTLGLTVGGSVAAAKLGPPPLGAEERLPL